MRIRDLTTEPRFLSDLERRYTLIYIGRCERTNAFIYLLLNCLFWLAVAITARIADFKPGPSQLIGFAAPAMIASSMLAMALLRSSAHLRRAQLICYLTTVIAMYLAAKIDTMDRAGHSGLAVLWVLGASFGIALLAFRNRVHIAVVLLCSVLYADGLKEYPEPEAGWIVATLLTFLMSTGQVFVHRISKIVAMNSFRQQSTFTPKQILLQAIEAEAPVSEVFRPKERFCACVCSDWRQFQAWASQAQPERLAATVTDYYRLQIKLLDSVFPEGNFFMDWIADELFVVAFTTDTSGPSTVARASLEFARLCIAAKPDFANKYGAPLGIDIGLSCGLATVGILGPEGNSKATALGAAPGQARRLQNVAKGFRLVVGEKDRILVHPVMGQYVDLAGKDFKLCPIQDWMNLRDVNVDRLYMDESATAAQPSTNVNLKLAS